MYLKLRNKKWIQKIAPSNNLPTVPCPWILTHNTVNSFLNFPSWLSFIPIFVTNSSQTSLLPMVIPKFRSFAFSKPGTTAFSACVWSIFLCSSTKIMFKWWICIWDSFRIDQKIIYLQGIHWLLSALHLCSKIWQFHLSCSLLYLYLSTDKEVLWAESHLVRSSTSVQSTSMI